MSKWLEEEYSELIGKTIKSVRELTNEEHEQFGWRPTSGGFVFICTDGTAIIPSCDPEGNGPGFIFVGETKMVTV
jgi:hypothetical protein